MRKSLYASCFLILFDIIEELLGDGLFMNYYYQKKVGLNVFCFWREMFKWLVPVCLLTGTGYVIQSRLSIDSWFKLITFACAYSLVYALTLYFIGPDTKQKCMASKKSKGYLANWFFFQMI